MRCTRLLGWTALALLGGSVPSWGQDPPKGPQPAKARLDLYGDPLPEGAIARLGSVRFRHLGAVHAVAYSPDGKLLAASSDGQNMVVIWDRLSGRKLQELPLAEKGYPLTELQFSSDGRQLYASSWFTFRAWSVRDGKEANEIPRPPGDTRVLGYSRDLTEMILLDNQKMDIVRWRIRQGTELARSPKPEGDLYEIGWAGEQLLVPAFDGKSVAMWDGQRRRKLWSIEATRQKEYPSLPMTFSSDGTLFAVEAPPRVISVYESVSGKKVRQIEAKVGEFFWSLRISPDKRTIAGSNWDGTLRLWDLEGGRERVKIPAIEGWTTYVFFAPDSKTFATGGPNNAHGVLLWDTASGKRIDSFQGTPAPCRRWRSHPMVRPSPLPRGFATTRSCASGTR